MLTKQHLDTIRDSVIAMIQRTCNPIIQRINAHTERLKAIEEHLEATTSDAESVDDLRTQTCAAAQRSRAKARGARFAEGRCARGVRTAPHAKAIF